MERWSWISAFFMWMENMVMVRGLDKIGRSQKKTPLGTKNKVPVVR